MTLTEIAKKLKNNKENIILIYAFNSTGKTRLSVEYKDLTKNHKNGNHAGVYYNAYSEDLFNWDNDEKNNGANKKLNIIPSNLNKLHSLLKEDDIKEKLIPYNPSYNFYFNSNKDTLDHESISFYKEGDEVNSIKISRGEERIFIWCFFLALFEVEGWADEQNEHILIDDPVSSLDDNNIFITARLILDLLEKHCDNKKLIITTHHMGLFSILQDWLCKGENASKFKKKTIIQTTQKKGEQAIVKERELEENKYSILFLEKKEDKFKLIGKKKGIHLYHLLIMQILDKAIKEDDLNTYHFVLLRQIMETIVSFLGEGRFGYLLDKINITDPNKKTDIINALSHEKLFTQKLSIMKEEEKTLFKEVFEGITTTLPFSL